jgi:hypothetical protein
MWRQTTWSSGFYCRLFIVKQYSIHILKFHREMKKLGFVKVKSSFILNP